MKTPKHGWFINLHPRNWIAGPPCHFSKILINYLVGFAFLIQLANVASASEKKTISGHSFQDSSKNVYINVVPSKSKVYVGEAFTIKYLLYYSIPVIDPGKELDFNFKDSYMEEYPGQEKQDSKMINGKLFHIILIKKLLLISKDAGPFNIPSITMNLKINNPADTTSFFGGEKTASKKFSSAPRVINVLPLPPNNDPAVFSGAVGDFVLTNSFIATKKTANTIKVVLNINGTGDLKFAKFNAPQLPKGIDIFNENNTETHALTDEGISVKHVYSFDMVANYRGNYNIGPLTFLFFNNADSKYVKFISGTYKWNVENGAVMPKSLVSVHNNQKQHQPDILYTKLNFTGDKPSGLFFGSVYGYLLLTLTCLFFFGGIVYSWHLRSKDVNKAFYNYKSARKEAFKNLRKLEVIYEKLDSDTFSKNLIAIFQKYLSDRNFIRYGDFSSKNVALSLQHHRVPDGVVQQVFGFFNEQYNIRFSLNKQISVNKGQYCLKLEQIIENIDSYTNG